MSNETLLKSWVFIFILTLIGVMTYLDYSSGYTRVVLIPFQPEVIVTQEIHINNISRTHEIQTSKISNSSSKSNGSNMCPKMPPNLQGDLHINLTNKINISNDIKEAKRFNVKLGGIYSPPQCTSNHHVALIIPFRDREEHLKVFLHYIHPFLQRQLIKYRIFVIEQAGEKVFNRGKLFNVGFVEAMKRKKFGCIVMHDVDLIPENDQNLYYCPSVPRHLSVKVDVLKYKLPYSTIFGGVAAMMSKHYKLVNGYSNKFWGWGGEDDDFYNRIRDKGLGISRYAGDITRYKMFKHKQASKNPQRKNLMKVGIKEHHKNDGLSTLKYKLLKVKLKPLYTWILVNIDQD